MSSIPPISVTRTTSSRPVAIDLATIEFGKLISDHMFVADYDAGKWKTAAIVPYGDLTMSPAILALHYGQAVFEGMKAYRMVDGNISVFRATKNFERLNKSLERMCMPPIPIQLLTDGLTQLLEIDSAWIPHEDGSSLYIRPVVFATEARLGVKISEQYKLVILTSPVGAYYTKPLRVKVEQQYVRAAEGGVGSAKCAGNYGASYYPAQLAKQEGFDQVLWTDSKLHKYIDEAGTMNVMFVIDGKLVTPSLTTAILDGVTRDSILQLAPELDVQADVRRVSIDELEEGLKNGKVTEAFGAGTAAVVAPIQTINIFGKDYRLPEITESSFQQRVRNKLMAIRLGTEPDTFNWNLIINNTTT